MASTDDYREFLSQMTPEQRDQFQSMPNEQQVYLVNGWVDQGRPANPANQSSGGGGGGGSDYGEQAVNTAATAATAAAAKAVWGKIAGYIASQFAPAAASTAASTAAGTTAGAGAAGAGAANTAAVNTAAINTAPAGGIGASVGSMATGAGYAAMVANALLSLYNFNESGGFSGNRLDRQERTNAMNPVGVMIGKAIGDDGKLAEAIGRWTGADKMMELGLNAFGSSKGKDQRIRDAYRGSLRDSGFLDQDYQYELSGGTKFDLGAEEVLRSDGEESRIYHLPWEKDERTGEVVGSMAGLANVLAGESDSRELRENLNNMFSNVVLSEAGNAEGNIKKIYDDLGLDRNTVYNAAADAWRENRIDADKRDAIFAATDKIYGIANPTGARWGDPNMQYNEKDLAAMDEIKRREAKELEEEKRRQATLKIAQGLGGGF